MFNLFKKQTPLQCSVLLCSALLCRQWEADYPRLTVFNRYKANWQERYWVCHVRVCAFSSVKTRLLTQTSSGQDLTLLGRRDTQDPARTQRDLFRFCHNAIPMYVGLAATHGLLSAGGEPGGVCASVLYLPSYIYIVHIYVEAPIKYSTTFCNYHSIL